MSPEPSAPLIEQTEASSFNHLIAWLVPCFGNLETLAPPHIGI